MCLTPPTHVTDRQLSLPREEVPTSPILQHEYSVGNGGGRFGEAGSPEDVDHHDETIHPQRSRV